MKLIKWKGNPEISEKNRCDFRWIKDKVERDKWIREHYEEEEEK